MFLYNLTLQSPTSINQAVVGNFSGGKQQEIVVAKGTIIEMHRPDPTTGKLALVLRHNVFGIIRSMLAFKLIGTSKDYLIAGSDSGRIVILEYNVKRNVFEKVHQETFGKSGSRRMVPGQYLAMDSKGRAVMIASVEKQKFVYILNRDMESRLTISSPLEAHKSHAIVFSCVGLDVGFENPIFACLEVDHSELEAENRPSVDSVDKVLTYYELDLGLNHVVRKWSDPVDQSANLLVAIPGGADGPSGVLVCSENYVTWKHQNHAELRVPIPRHRNSVNEKIIIVSSTSHKTKNMFFVLLQTEEGDIFKVTIEFDIEIVKALKIKYFDTIPITSAMCILKSGYLFAASEQGPHGLYQIIALGDNADEPEFSNEDIDVPAFTPRELKNIQATDTLENMAPILDSKVFNFGNEESPQLYALTGAGVDPALRIIRHGLSVNELAISELPGVPIHVWTVKRNMEDSLHSLILVSFINATIALSIGESIEEVSNSGFIASVSTIHTGQFADSSYIQVHSGGFRHIKSDSDYSEWKVPNSKIVRYAASNTRQLVLALSGGVLVYFEMDVSGNLREHERTMDIGAEIVCLSLAAVQADRQRSRYLAVGCVDFTVRIFSLDIEDRFEGLSFQSVTAKPQSVLILEMFDFESDQSSGTLFLNVGLENGVLIRMEVDRVTGALSDPRSRFLGPKGVKLFAVSIGNLPAVLALSSRPWLNYVHQERNYLTPLSYSSLEYASAFVSEQVPEGIIAIAGNTLRIICPENLNSIFNQHKVSLSYIPRKLCFSPELFLLAVCETSHRMFSPAEKQKYDQAIDSSKIRDDFCAPPGNWASCIKLLDPLSTYSCFNFEDNEAAFSALFCTFSARPDEDFLIVGSAKDVSLDKKICSSGFLYVFTVNKGDKTLSFVHKTAVEDIPYSLCAFQGRILVGVGKFIRIYDIGMKKLLRKCENKGLPNAVMTIHTQGNRIIVGDIQESCHYLIYKPSENIMIIFADDVVSRWITSTVLLDYDTVAGGDKFGNFFVIRISMQTSEEIDLDPTGLRISERGYLMGAPNKLERTADFFLGDIITSINKATYVFGGREILIYTTLLGTIGAMVPFYLREDVKFFQNLELHMRNEAQPLFGRDHLSFRSSYIPVKNVIDGDLCEQYSTLSYEKKREIALSMDKTPNEIMRKIQDFRAMNAL